MESTRTQIGQDDIVTVRGQHLYVGQSPSRFFMRGMAFPTPPPPRPGDNDDEELDLSGWIAVLEQLADETDVNAVRVYEMDCHKDYGAFLERAAELGIYVIVPLTSRRGDGVLSRDAVPPKCYPRKLYEYGAACLRRYWHHPNVLAGVVGNEVMNNLLTWQSAPCVKAYLDDLAAHTRALRGPTSTAPSSSQRTSLPLMYATQHDSPSAELHPDEAVKLTLDYLACNDGSSTSLGASDFIFGINIESWCSSLQTFQFEEDGVTESSYHSLWETLMGGNKTRTIMDAVTGQTTIVNERPISSLPVTAPVVFSEMGCSKEKYNRDNSVQPKFVRDWKQVSLVLEGGMMSNVFSGFVSYGYDGGGSPLFRTMGGSNMWDGKHPLPPSPDYDNFRHQLSRAVDNMKADGSSSSYDIDNTSESSRLPFSSCDTTVETLKNVWDLDLYPLADMPSYISSSRGRLKWPFVLTLRVPVTSSVFRLEREDERSIRATGTQGLFLLLAMMFLTFLLAMPFCRRQKDEKENEPVAMSIDESSSLLLANAKCNYS